MVLCNKSKIGLLTSYFLLIIPQGTDDFADFYYATDLDQNPTWINWVYIGTKQPNGGGLKEISIDYQMPQANTHMVRVNYRYNGGARCVHSALSF
jgi:hypothetical protein